MGLLPKTLLLLCYLGASSSYAQHRWEEEAKQAKINNAADIDVHFYHIKLEPALDQPYIKASTRIDYSCKEADKKLLWFSFTDKLKISKIDGAESFEQKGNSLFVKLKDSPAKDSKNSLYIEYEGKPPTEKVGEGEIGVLYTSHGAEKWPIIASSSYPHAAHLWFPNHPRNADKADSIHIDLTIEDRKSKFVSADGKENQIPFTAVANGVLENTLKGEKTRTFQWRHRYPIEPQYVGFAVSNFAKSSVNFANENKEKFPINFYVLPEEMEEAKSMMDRCAEIMTCMTNTFGRYPFGKEGFSVVDIETKLSNDGVPAQGLVMLEDMKSFHMYRLVHNISRMWFGCHIHSQQHQDAWISEAFAAYGEGVWQEYKRGLGVFQMILDQNEYYEGGSLYGANHEKMMEMSSSKGMYVIHMLRGIMGEVYFFEMLKGLTEQKRLKKSAINSKELQQLCEYYASENVTQDYSYFFNDWVYGEYFPTFEISFTNKKGTVEVKLNQSSPNGKFFTVPATIDMVLDDDSKVSEQVKIKQASETFNLGVNKPVKELFFDQANWIFNELSWVRFIQNPKTPIENLKISSSNHKRDINVSFSSPKKQDVVVELILLADGVEIPQDKIIATQNFAGLQGDFNQGFKIPLALNKRAAYKLRIVGKSDIYTKILRLQQIESKFE